MSRPGLLDWLCQAGKAVFKTERIPVDEKTLIRKEENLVVNTQALLADNGGLEVNSTGKIGIKTSSSLIKKNNTLELSDTANAPTSDKWKNPIILRLTGAVSGYVIIDGSEDEDLSVTGLDVSKANAGILGTAHGGTGNANGTVGSLTTPRSIDGVNFNGSADIIHYGTCATAAATAAKVVALTGFKLVTGSRVMVRFTVSNTAVNPTLNVNNTGAKAIRYRNEAIERYFLEANRTYEFVYDGTAWQLVGDLNCPYELCEFYYFRHPTLRPGFEPLTGGVIANANTKYPRAWAYLGTPAGQLLCKTESEWQALSTKTYYTLADGTKLGFNGIGGVPFFVRNTSNGSLRMPDIRGTYPEPAGFDSLNVGDSRLDAIREVNALWRYILSTSDHGTNSTGGCAYWDQRHCDITSFTSRTGQDIERDPGFHASKMVPVGKAVKPRSFGILACAYLGQPAS